MYRGRSGFDGSLRRGWRSPLRLRHLTTAGLARLDGASADACLGDLVARREFDRPWVAAFAEAFVRVRGYEALGFRSLGDWSRERIGFGARAVREWARVWGALRGLPLLREAVLSGEVSWTVAGRIVSLATDENQSACLDTVRGRTVRAVDTMLAVLRGAEGLPREAPGAEGDDPQQVLRIECTGSLRQKWHAAIELARRVAGEELSPGQVVEAIAAEVLASGGGAVAPETSSAKEGSGKQPRDGIADRASGLAGERWPRLAARPRRHAHDLPRLAQLDRMLAALPPRALDAWLHERVARRQETDFEIGRVLARMVGRRLHRELGFPTFDEYVRERLFLSPRTARRLVRIARAEATAPAVANAFRRGRITALQAEVLLRTEPGDEQVAIACRTTLRGLEDDAPPPLVVSAPRPVARLFRALVRQLGLERVLDHALATWLEARQLVVDYADFARDGWRCTVPGCTARRNLQSHHIRFRSRGGPDEAWNRTTLCAFHHLRGVHAGRVRIRGRAPAHLVYRLGIGAFASGDRKLACSA